MVRNWYFALILSLLAPQFTWGFSSERTENYKKIALNQKLHLNPTWLKLGHYHRGLFGNFRSQIRGDFFLSENGHENPEAELLATLDALFTASEKPAQCRYLARTRWLRSVLAISPEDLLICPERDAWKNQLGAKEAYIIFASSDLNSASSSFGHTFLRLHNPGNNELLDYGVNYAAITGEDSGAIFALKGLLGFYPGNYSMLPYHQKIREYNNLEGRDIWEYKLKLSEEDVAFLIDHLLELDGSFSYYYFLDENCSYQILELLNLARSEMNLTKSFHDSVIPLETLKVLANENFLEDEALRSSLQAEWRTRYAGLDLDQKKELRDAVKDPQKFHFSENLNNKEKAETLEATLSYLAIKDYRDQKESKDDKYALAIQRAQLGLITDPIEITKPRSPLLSQNSMGAYLGYGKEDQKDYFSLKYRRTLHDLIADDVGFSPFFHLEVLSLEFRYFTENNLDLNQLTLIKALSSAPTNILDHPLTWSMDLGTQPKLAPYFDFGFGSSFDVTAKMPTRYVILANMENRTEKDHYAGYLGPRNILVTKWNPRFRAMFDISYLYDFQKGGFMWDNQVAVSLSRKQNEIRLEYKNRLNIPDWRISLIQYF